MKGSLSREQLLAVAAGGGLLLLAAAAAWFGLAALGEKQAEAQALADQMGNPALAALVADPGGAARAKRESGEMQKLDKELREKDGATLGIWAQGTREAIGEGQDWAKDPGKWKDRLIQVQSRLQKDSSARRVEFGPDFYLGLEAYRQKSPTAEEVPGLALHLSVAERLVEHLMEARKTPEQYPTTCEFRSLTGPGTGIEKAPEAVPPAPPPKPGAPQAGPERKTFRAEIRCSPEVLYEYVGRLARDKWLFILTGLSVTNSRQTFPLRSEIAKKFEVPEAATGGQTVTDKKEKRLLEILGGNEDLTVLLEVDFVAWKGSEEAKVAAPAPAPAP